MQFQLLPQDLVYFMSEWFLSIDLIKEQDLIFVLAFELLLN